MQKLSCDIVVIGKENVDRNGTQIRDLWITVHTLSHLSYLDLCMVAVPNSQLVFAGMGQPQS